MACPEEAVHLGDAIPPVVSGDGKLLRTLLNASDVQL
jgi:hypothetical protein